MDRTTAGQRCRALARATSYDCRLPGTSDRKPVLPILMRSDRFRRPDETLTRRSFLARSAALATAPSLLGSLATSPERVPDAHATGGRRVVVPPTRTPWVDGLS